MGARLLPPQLPRPHCPGPHGRLCIPRACGLPACGARRTLLRQAPLVGDAARIPRACHRKRV